MHTYTISKICPELNPSEGSHGSKHTLTVCGCAGTQMALPNSNLTYEAATIMETVTGVLAPTARRIKAVSISS